MSLLPAFMLVDLLTITRRGGTTRTAMGAINDQDPVTVFSDAKCRLDQINVAGDPREAGVRPNARRVVYADISLDVQIGDFVAVTRPGGEVVDNHRVKAIDRPGLFRPSHLEIEISPIGAA